MISIVDYGMGNIFSVKSALSYLGVDSEYVSTPEEILKAKKIILPGVGSYKMAMETLHKKNLVDSLRKVVNEQRTPLLGICLGMQLLGKYSTEEEKTEGLGFIDGEVERFQVDPKKYKIPHVGFAPIELKGSSKILHDLPNDPCFYFTHSYRMQCHDDSASAYANYGEKFVACVEKDHIFGTQFHPEKSQSNGLKLLIKFLEY